MSCRFSMCLVFCVTRNKSFFFCSLSSAEFLKQFRHSRKYFSSDLDNQSTARPDVIHSERGIRRRFIAMMRIEEAKNNCHLIKCHVAIIRKQRAAGNNRKLWQVVGSFGKNYGNKKSRNFLARVQKPKKNR